MRRLGWFAMSFCAALVLGGRPAEAADERLERLTPEHREWIEAEVVYIITEREREFFLSLETVDERARFIEAFWRKRDPNPTTIENEFKDEHYRRFDLANENFAGDSFKPGWQTDRGKMVILLGEPRERQRFDGLNEIVSTEVWFYQSASETTLPPFFYLVFFRPRDIGEYRLYHPVIDGPRSLLRGRYASLQSTDPSDILSTLYDIAPELSRASLSFDPSDPGDARSGRASLGTDILLTRIEESPKRSVKTDYLDAAGLYGRRVSADYSFNFVPNRSVFSPLLAPDGTSVVHYSVELDPQDFALETDERRSRYYTTLDVTLEVRDAGDNLILSENSEIGVELTAEQMDQVKAMPFAFQNSFPLVPGEFDVSVLLKNRVMKRFTVAERRLEIPEPGGDEPALGRPIVAFDVEPRTDARAGSFAMGRFHFRPAADHLFALGETMTVGVEALNVPRGSRLRMRLGSAGVAVADETIDVADGSRAVIAEELDLTGIDAGDFELEVRLEDGSGTVLARETTDVHLTPRTAVPRAGYVHRRGFDVDAPGRSALARGDQFWMMKRFDDARRELEKAVAANNPDLPMARWKLASVYLRQGEPDRSLALLSPLEAEHGDQYEVAAGLGFAHYLQRDFARAVPYLEKAAELRPAGPALLNALGESYERTGDRELAVAMFERSLALQPGQHAIASRLDDLRSTTR